MEIVSNLIHSILSIATAVVVQVLELLRISSLIGSYIVSYSIECVISLHALITMTCGGLKILCGDFMVFLQDVVKICAFCFEGSGVVLSSILEGMLNFLIYLRDLMYVICTLPINICTFLLRVIDNFINFFVIAAEHFKCAVTLIGRGIWLFFMLIPYSIVYTISYIPLLVIDLAYFSHAATADFLLAVSQRFYNGIVKIGEFFTDIPCEACAGLLTGLTVTCLIYRKRVLLKYYLIVAYHFHVNTLNKLFHIVKITFQQCIRKIYLCRHFMSRRGNPASWNGDISSELIQENVSQVYNASTSNGVGSKKLVNLQKTLEKEMEERLCSVCRERRKSVIVLPCRHLCMCEECVFMVKRISRMCPLCRCPIINTINVYM